MTGPVIFVLLSRTSAKVLKVIKDAFKRAEPLLANSK